MTKSLQPISFDPAKCRLELAAFKKLLDSKQELGERTDIQRFFKQRKHLSAFIGTFAPNIGPAKLIAFEFPFLGDFVADIVLGDKDTGSFCVVEFENGKVDGIFKKTRGRSTAEWSPRFEHGFSQLVDWCYTLDNFKKTDRFAKDFGHGHIRFFALLILGRDTGVAEYDRKRLRWRTEKVRVDSHTIECLSLMTSTTIWPGACASIRWRPGLKSESGGAAGSAGPWRSSRKRAMLYAKCG